MNKLLKRAMALSFAGAMCFAACVLAACGCNTAETTTAAEETLTLPIDYFDDYSEGERLEAIQEDIDAIKELQNSGVDTEEKKVAYELAVEDLLERGPEYKEIVDKGREEYKIDTDKLQEKHDEQIVESIEASKEAESAMESLSSEIEAGTDESGNYTLPYGESEIQLPTVRIK